MSRALVFALLLLTTAARVFGEQAPAAPPEPVLVLVNQLELALKSGQSDLVAPLLAPDADTAALLEFDAQWIVPHTTEVALRERDRVPVPGGLRLTVDGFVANGSSGRLGTWQIDVTLPRDGQPPRIRTIKTLSFLEGLYRLALDETRQFSATDFHLVAEDLDLSLPRGTVFVAEADGGPTGLLLLGKGLMTFSPAPETEQGQMRLLTGTTALRTSFDQVFVRVNPHELSIHTSGPHLQRVSVNPRDLRDAKAAFDAAAARTYSVDLSDLTRDVWSLLPTTGDLLAEVRTKRFGTLTYARVSNQPEDITVFDREHHRNLSVYASKARLSARGPFYNEDDDVDFEVRDTTVDASFAPERAWFDGRTTLSIRVKSQALTTLTLKLAAPLTVRSITSSLFGRLLFLRVRNQDTVVVNLPDIVTKGTEMTLTVAYGGRLEPQTLDREVIQSGQSASLVDESLVGRPEPSFLYSNRSYWYPQAGITTYGRATIRLAVPRRYAAVCTGEEASGSPVDLPAGNGGDPRLLYVFSASQPVRYLACVISRFVEGEKRTIRVDRGPGPAVAVASASPHYSELRLSTRVAMRQRSRTKDLVAQASDIASYYAGILHDAPYQSFTLAVVESQLPGGHSPPYFAALNAPLPSTPYVWRDDPASFHDYPEFFLAHELAHQWWGQAIGWKNYHEQWLSEGFAQYFAALYAEHRRGPDVFDGIIRSMGRWGVSNSDQGPIYLGYRLGHLRGDTRVFRAVVYNKGAMVLHMLRRLVGDDAFFKGLARFYAQYRFQKAGTDDLQRSFEAETGRPLQAFFEKWVYGSELPLIRWTTRTEGTGADAAVVIDFEQHGQVFEVPITVTLQMADGSMKDVIVPVTDRHVERRIPYSGTLRAVRVNRDGAALIRTDS